MNKSNRVLRLLEQLQNNAESHIIQAFLMVRGMVIGFGQDPLHPDNVTDEQYWNASGIRPLCHECNISRVDLIEWLRELAWYVYNGKSVTEINKINDKYKLPHIPNDIAMEAGISNMDWGVMENPIDPKNVGADGTEKSDNRIEVSQGVADTKSPEIFSGIKKGLFKKTDN